MNLAPVALPDSILVVTVKGVAMVINQGVAMVINQGASNVHTHVLYIVAEVQPGHEG